MATAAIVAGASIVSAKLQGDAAKKAAGTSARATRDAAQISAEAAEQARQDVLDQTLPALDRYRAEIYNQREALNQGATDVMALYRQSNADANQMLQQTGANAEAALMGSQYAAQGMPSAQIYSQVYQPQAAGMPQAAGAAEGGMMQIQPAAPPVDAAGQPAPGEPGGPPMDIQPAAAPAAAPVAPGMPPPEGMPPPGMQPMATPGGIGFRGAAGQIEAGRQRALGDIAGYTQMGREDLTAGQEGALAAYQPYSDVGRQAVQREAALSGALGPEAQQQAMDAFMESPGQKYLREQQEKALLRGGAAMGGLGGGRIRTALQEQAMGIASTAQQQQLENIRSLAARGQQVAGQEAGVYTGTASQMAQLAQRAGLSMADIQRMSASEQANLAERTGMAISGMRQQIGTQQAMNVAGLGSQLAGTRGGLAADLAASAQNRGLTELEVGRGLATQLANIGTRSGTQLSGLQQQAGAATAAGQMAQGQIAGGMVGTLGNIAAYGMQGGFNQPQPNPAAVTPGGNIGSNIGGTF